MYVVKMPYQDNWMWENKEGFIEEWLYLGEKWKS